MVEERFDVSQAEALTKAFEKEGVDFLFVGKGAAIMMGYPVDDREGAIACRSTRSAWLEDRKKSQVSVGAASCATDNADRAALG